MQIGNIFTKITLVLCVFLPFLIPFGTLKNFAFQQGILAIAGVFGCLALLAKRTRPGAEFPKSFYWLIYVVIASCVVSIVVNRDLMLALLGEPNSRLGFLSLIASIVCAVLFSLYDVRKFLIGLYTVLCAVVVLSIPYSLLVFDDASRLPGLFSQSSIFACIIGASLILGFAMYEYYPKRKFLLLSLQIILGITLLATQSRSVTLIIFVILIWLLQKRFNRFRIAVMSLLLVLVAGTIVQIIYPTRFTDAGYLQTSIDYRVMLQTEAAKHSHNRLLFGYGIGNIPSVLNCGSLQADQLQTSCSEGLYFNSSHNIYLDRVLEIGILGSISLILLVVLGIIRGLRSSHSRYHLIALGLLLISVYYLTNVTHILLDLLFWILLVKLFRIRHPETNHA